jgi:hypothetical protein
MPQEDFWKWWEVKQRSSRTLAECEAKKGGFVFSSCCFCYDLYSLWLFLEKGPLCLGYQNSPILPLEYSDLYPDEMHCLLRGFDKLQSLVQKHDLNEDIAKLKLYVKKIHELLESDAYKFYQKDGKISWATLDSHDRFKAWICSWTIRFMAVLVLFVLIVQLLQSIDFAGIMANTERAKRVTNLWHGYAELYSIFSSDSPDPVLYKEKLGAWMSEYCSGPCPDSSSSSSSASSASSSSSARGAGRRVVRVARSAPRPNTAAFDAQQAMIAPLYPHADATPYVHTLAHFQFFFPDSLKPYSCSSLEKRNHLHTIDFFRTTTLNGFGRTTLKEILVREMLLYSWDL